MVKARDKLSPPGSREHSVILTFPIAAVGTARTPEPACRYTWRSVAQASDCCWRPTTRPPSA